MAKQMEASKQVQRVFSQEKKLVTDTFKLTVETMKKDIGVEGAPIPRIENFEHSHIYRTYSSSGKFNKVCSAVGGHTHKVTVEEVDGQFKVTVGPAIGDNGQPISFGKGKKIIDNHTHEAVYLRSDEVMLKRKDADVAKFTASQEAKWNLANAQN